MYWDSISVLSTWRYVCFLSGGLVYFCQQGIELIYSVEARDS